jgi:hypothetical protein
MEMIDFDVAWRFYPANESFDDRIVFDQIDSSKQVITLINTIEVLFAELGLRSGYDLRLNGSCHKGPQGLVWPKIELEFEDNQADRVRFLAAFKKKFPNSVGYEGE